MGSGAAKTAGRAAMVIVLAVWQAACLQPVRRVTVDNSFINPDAGRTAWRRVAVLPFTGEPAFRRPAAEWFSFRLRRQGLFEVVDPSLAEIELKRNGMLFAEAATTIEEAREAGRILGVDGVVFGSVDAGKPPAGQPTTVGASVVDMATGKMVAGGVHGDFAWSRDAQEVVIAVVASVGEDLLPVFFAAAGRIWMPPATLGAEGPPAQGRDPQEREPALR